MLYPPGPGVLLIYSYKCLIPNVNYYPCESINRWSYEAGPGTPFLFTISDRGPFFILIQKYTLYAIMI